MSQITNIIALNSAQVAHQATQVARVQDKRRAEVQRLAQDSRDTFEHRLHDATDADDPDAELPDRQAPGYEQLYFHDGDGHPIAPGSTSTPGSAHPVDPLDSAAHALEELYHHLTTSTPPSTPNHPLYEHLDVMG